MRRVPELHAERFLWRLDVTRRVANAIPESHRFVALRAARHWSVGTRYLDADTDRRSASALPIDVQETLPSMVRVNWCQRVVCMPLRDSVANRSESMPLTTKPTDTSLPSCARCPLQSEGSMIESPWARDGARCALGCPSRRQHLAVPRTSPGTAMFLIRNGTSRASGAGPQLARLSWDSERLPRRASDATCSC